jgi:hypothetical protein
MAQGFRVFVWDPVLIISQIVALQGFYYLSWGFWVLIVDLVCGYPTTLDQLFSYHEFDGGFEGWFFLIVHILHYVTCALGLLWIVRRAKQCLDFALTVSVLHFLLCLLYFGFPWSVWWWVTTVVGVALMTFLGEVLCMRFELTAIPLSDPTGKS